MLTVVFICTGNICRRPMAEGLLKFHWKMTGSGDLTVTSMGINGMHRQPASDFSRQICLENGIDIESHRSRRLVAEEIMDADIIFVMEGFQLKHLQLLFPMFRDKIHMLGAWPGKRTWRSNIKDPIGRPLKTYRAVFKAIDSHIRRILPDLLSLAGHR